jgi:hypothetical protein
VQKTIKIIILFYAIHLIGCAKATQTDKTITATPGQITNAPIEEIISFENTPGIIPGYDFQQTTSVDDEPFVYRYFSSEWNLHHVFLTQNDAMNCSPQNYAHTKQTFFVEIRFDKIPTELIIKADEYKLGRFNLHKSNDGLEWSQVYQTHYDDRNEFNNTSGELIIPLDGQQVKYFKFEFSHYENGINESNLFPDFCFKDIVFNSITNAD